MNRCPAPSLVARRRLYVAVPALLFAAALLGGSVGSAAQGASRNFSAQVQFGEMDVSKFPTVEINGQPIRTTPGFRLFSPQNTLVQANNYKGQQLPVAYLIEPQTRGLHQAWILTPAEIEKYRK